MHGKNIWKMDEREFIEIGRKMVGLYVSEKCHSVWLSRKAEAYFIFLMGRLRPMLRGKSSSMFH